MSNEKHFRLKHNFFHRQIRFKRRVQCLVLCALLGILPIFCSAETTSEKIEQQKEKIDTLKEQQEDAQDTIAAFSQIRETLEGKLGNLNTQLTDISTQLEEIQNQILAKENEIDEAEESLDAAQQEADAQYESMKKRIQYIYENGDQTMAMLLFGSDSLADFLNRSNYVESLSTYDRQMMTEYETTVADITAKKEQLNSEKEELEVLQNEANAQKDQISAWISNTKTDIDTSISAMATAQELSDTIAAQLEEAEAYEKQLEQQKADEDAKRLEEIRQQEASFTSSGAIAASASDETLLAAIIYCEARGESYEGQLAVGSVVLNRVDSPSFPNTISGVIYQSGQFSPVASGKFAMVLASGLQTESCNQAAREVLAGNRTNNFLYFRRANVQFSFPVTIIGNHAFY